MAENPEAFVSSRILFPTCLIMQLNNDERLNYMQFSYCFNGKKTRENWFALEKSILTYHNSRYSNILHRYI